MQSECSLKTLCPPHLNPFQTSAQAQLQEPLPWSPRSLPQPGCPLQAYLLPPQARQIAPPDLFQARKYLPLGKAPRSVLPQARRYLPLQKTPRPLPQSGCPPQARCSPPLRQTPRPALPLFLPVSGPAAPRALPPLPQFPALRPLLFPCFPLPCSQPQKR